MKNVLIIVYLKLPIYKHVILGIAWFLIYVKKSPPCMYMHVFNFVFYATDTHVVFVSEFRLHGAKSAKLPTQLKSGQQWIPRWQSYEGRGRKRFVGVNPRMRVTQRVLCTRRDTLITTTPGTSAWIQIR